MTMFVMGATVLVLGMVTACAAESIPKPGSPVMPQPGAAHSETTGSQHAQGEVIIKLKGALSGSEREAALKTLNLTSVRRLEGINADLVRIPEGETVDQAVERLKREPSVDYAEPNFKVRIQ